MADTRIAAHPVDALFTDRWSPRAFTSAPIADDDLATLFEAARWAPSAYNVQPWRFLYARRDTAAWQKFLDVLVPFNQSWAKNASVILLCLSDSLTPPNADGESKPSHSHSFDAGAAWMSLALQATRLGLAAHGMTGVDFGRARTDFAIPERLRIECAIVVGKPGDKTMLPEHLQAREAPSDRRAIETFAFENGLPSDAG